MLFYTIAMIVWWVLVVFSAEVVRATNTKKNEGKIKTEDTVVAGCLYLIIGLPYMLGELVYLLFALKVDPYLYPTYLMIGLYIIEFIVAMLLLLFSRITGKEQKMKDKAGLYSYFSRFLTMIYFGYMLWAVIN